MDDEPYASTDMNGDDPGAGTTNSLGSSIPNNADSPRRSRLSFVSTTRSEKTRVSFYQDDFRNELRDSQRRLEADLRTALDMLTKLTSDMDDWRASPYPPPFSSTSEVGGSRSFIGRIRSSRSATSEYKERRISEFPSTVGGPGLESSGRGGGGSSSSSGGAGDLGFVAATLPLNWPTVLEKRTFGQMANGDNSDCSYFQTLASSSKKTSFFASTAESEASSKPNGSWPQGFSQIVGFRSEEDVGLWTWLKTTWRSMRDPNSSASACVEIVGVFILLFDLMTVPFMLAWQLEYEGIISAFALVSLFYWTFDFLTAWFRGFYLDGALILDMKLIAKRYLRTWCLMDATIVVTEWFGLLMKMAGDKESSEKLRFARLGKLLRLLSALRIIRLGRILETSLQRSISENIRLAIQICGMSFVFLWLNHMTTCAWFTIGTMFPTDTGNHWVEMSWDFHGQTLKFMETPQFYQYITAFHWAMSQTTLGAMEVAPANGLERTFNIFALLMGFLFGSTLVSTLSAGMVEFQARNRDRYQKLHLLRRYMIENRVPAGLALQVQRQLENRLQQRLPVTASQVTALTMLSSSLQQELHSNICRPHAVTHPTLGILACMDGAWFRKLCHMSMAIQIYRPNDEIFVAGAEAVAVFYTITGLCKYEQEPETSPVTDFWETEVQGRTWVCEAALWSYWTHVGTLEALDPCSILLIDPDKAGSLAEQHILIRKIAREYASSFHDRILLAKPPDSRYPDDLQVPFTDQGDLVYSMSQEAQVHIGLTALAWAPNAAGAEMDKLRCEVQTGKSVVVLNSQGHAERVVSLLILQLEQDDKYLYQIGEIEYGTLAAKVPVLPAVKRLKGEPAMDALARLTEEKLMLTQDDFSVGRIEDTVKEQQSKLGVNSRYLRKLCHAEFRGMSSSWRRCEFDHEPWENHPESVESTVSAAVAAVVSTPNWELLQSLEYWFVETSDEGLAASQTGGLYCWLKPSEAERLSSISETWIMWYLRCLSIPWTTSDSEVISRTASSASDSYIAI